MGQEKILVDLYQILQLTLKLVLLVVVVEKVDLIILGMVVEMVEMEGQVNLI